MGDIFTCSKKRFVFLLFSHIGGNEDSDTFPFETTFASIYTKLAGLLPVILIRMTRNCLESSDRSVAAEHSACVTCFRSDNGISSVSDATFHCSERLCPE